MSGIPSIPAPVFAAWSLDPASPQPLGSGLINHSFLVRDQAGTPRVLQQVNPMFPPAVNEDIEAVTTHLAAAGLETPRLLRTHDGALCLPGQDGAWRLLSYMPGRVLDALENSAQAHAAGQLLARFHRALGDLEHEFRHVRQPVHAPARHLALLREALARHAGHRLHGAASALAESIFAAARALAPLPETPARVVHGDPKISNLVFEDRHDVAVCMLDLDTVGRMSLLFELGDALRSWCNAATEDDPRGRFSPELFEAAVAGYGEAARGWLLQAEGAAVVSATATIQVELAARFCADSLNESYFGWNPAAFPSRGEHNLARARGQIAVHRSLLEQCDRLEALAARAFSGG